MGKGYADIGGIPPAGNGTESTTDTIGPCADATL